jgi:CheY-like chemotaxis protein
MTMLALGISSSSHRSGACPSRPYGFLKVSSELPRPVILVVEDEWLLREDVVTALREAGMTVLEATRGEAALSLLDDSGRIDILVTDIRLGGGVCGWEVARRFRSLQPDGGVIYASGSPPDPARRVPDSFFFSKPCDARKLVAACRTLAEKPAGA